jgi:adenylosuccinate synthase
LDGQRVETFPTDLTVLARCRPVYETLPGWTMDISGTRVFSDLPQQAREYVTRIEGLLGIPVTYVGVGPARDQIIRR